MAPWCGVCAVITLGLCANAFDGDVLAALKQQVERIDRAITPTAASQRYAFDPDICQCQANSGAAPMLLEDFVERHCGGWGSTSRCVGVVEQGVRRVAPFTQTVLFSGANFTRESMQALKRQAVGHLNEQDDMYRSVKHIVGLLERGLAKQHGITDAEVADRAEEARRFQNSPDRTVALRVGVPGHSWAQLAEDRSCECFSITQARVLWDDAPDALPGVSARSAAGTRQDLEEFAPADLSWPSTPGSALALARGRLTDRRLGKAAPGSLAKAKPGEDTIEDYADLASEKYAKNNVMLTWFYMLCFPYAIMSEPYSDSGPLHPPYTSPCCSGPSACDCNPSLGVYNQGYIFPYAASSIFYYHSSPYGPCFTASPEKLESIPTNPSGRQWPERQCCSSHPSTSARQDNGENNEWKEMWDKHLQNAGQQKKKRRLAGSGQNEAMYSQEGWRSQTSEGGLLFFAPDSHVYDARLVDALYSFAKQGAGIRTVKLFSTTIVWFKLLGVSPPDSDLQHLGVTLELSKSVKYDGAEWRFLTLEMMGSGLMWTLTASTPPATGYDYLKEITMTYDDLSLRMVARYVADKRGQVYRTSSTDCQTFALDLAHRLSLHGRSLHSVPDGSFVHGPNKVTRFDHHEAIFGPLFLASCALGLTLLVATLALLRLAYIKTEGHKILRRTLAAAAAATFLLPLQTTPPVLAASTYAAWRAWQSYAKDFTIQVDDEDKEAPIAETELYPPQSAE